MLEGSAPVQRLASLLRCPTCGAPLRISADAAACGVHVFPVVGGIPRLLPPDLQRISAGPKRRGGQGQSSWVAAVVARTVGLGGVLDQGQPVTRRHGGELVHGRRLPEEVDSDDRPRRPGRGGPASPPRPPRRPADSR
jgi:uncharacterized protein YbaR (Trm112 family)